MEIAGDEPHLSITVSRKEADGGEWVAIVDGDVDVDASGRGSDPRQAVGDLVCGHPGLFNVIIKTPIDG